MTFEEIKESFNKERAEEDGAIVMNKVTKLINELGSSFLDLTGGELSLIQTKLAGYKFYLADYIASLNVEYEGIDLEIKQIRAVEWDRITEEIKAKEGKVKNKEQIENKLFVLTEEKKFRKMLFEALYYKFKLKISSIDSMLTALTQRISELKKQLEQI